MTVLSAIFGCSGLALTKTEADFFRSVQPWGFILFKRNVESPDQVRALTSALRTAVDREDAPILIDQEGGRVARLGLPHWHRYPPGQAYGALSRNDPLTAREIARLGGRLLAHDLSLLGINVDCLPVLDVPQSGAHDVIGDRAYSADPNEIAFLGRAAAEGLLAGGVLPVIKHIPGHGRAMSDSHEQLPVVDADLEALRAFDFPPFACLSDMPMAMTAHVVYRALDAKRPATTSRRIIQEVIRAEIGFDGLVMSDDVSMKALHGDFALRARQSLAAGCDIVLHCNGDQSEMEAAAAGCRPLKGHAARRAHTALGRIVRRPEPFDAVEGRHRFDLAFGGRFA